MKNKLITFLGALLIISACNKPEKIKSHLEGTWVCEYEIMEDGSKNFSAPYALVDFNYSDGFTLNEDGTGSTMWYGAPNGDIEWSNTKEKLIIHDQYWNGELINYEYSIENVTSSSMEFENYKGHRFGMKKE